MPAPESGRIASIARLLTGEAPLGTHCASIREVLAATKMQKLTRKGGMRDDSEPARQGLALPRENLAA